MFTILAQFAQTTLPVDRLFTYLFITLLLFTFWLCQFISLLHSEFISLNKKIAWLLVVLLLGPVGALFFMSFGRTYRKTSKNSRYKLDTVAAGMFESELDASDAKAKLEAEGTFCYSIQSDPSSNPYGTSSSVFVRYSDLAWAKELLQNLPSVTKCNNVTESMEKKIEDNNSMAESNKPAELVRAANFESRINAEFAQSILEEKGIVSQVQADDAGGWRPNLLTGGMGTWLLVRAGDLDNAVAILQESNTPVDDSLLEEEAMSFEPPSNA